MLTLYVKTGCPYSLAVQAKINELGADVVEKNISTNEHYLMELIEMSGRRQTPFFIDDECSVAIFESDDIIDYLNKKFGGTTSGGSDLPGEDAPNACPA